MLDFGNGTIGYEFDDGGRVAAGYKGSTGDCVTRALAILTEHPYKECYQALADAHGETKQRRGKNKGKKQPRSAANGVSKTAYAKVFKEFGLIRVPWKKGERPTYTTAFFEYGNCIVSTARHVCCLRDGDLRDTFDGRTYEWFPNEPGLSGYIEIEVRERKAMSIWIPDNGDWALEYAAELAQKMNGSS